LTDNYVHVAAGVILDGAGRVLLALRPLDKHKGGLWEFPGGKLEPGEGAREALIRELHEELHVDVLEAAPFLVVDHDYGDKQVRLDVWLVSKHAGTPLGREKQRIAWAGVAELKNYEFPEANLAIVTALQARFA
jgi:8-oxo-dGTP diphosphatase